MGQDESRPLVDDAVPPRNLTARSLDAVADYVKSGKAKRIVVLTGAGISTSAGIPDFRSPKTGLYSNLQRLNLPHAEAVFDIDYFRQNPDPFYVLANELYPGKFHPTISHAFIALLAQKGLLQMLFTQNIDCLERRAGVPSEKVIEAHGSFATQRCIDCKEEFPDDKMKEHVFAGKVPRCEECLGLVKPDIVFFGESLPKAFNHNTHQTVMADLVLVVGTSLSVFPFAGLPEMAREGVPRMLFNLERVGHMGERTDDVLELGHCDDGIRRLADALGWSDELDRAWRDVVGDEEAERQLRSQETRDEEVEDEVKLLADEVEAALHFEDDDDDDRDSTKNRRRSEGSEGQKAAGPKGSDGPPSTEPAGSVVPKAVTETKDAGQDVQPVPTLAETGGTDAEKDAKRESEEHYGQETASPAVEDERLSDETATPGSVEKQEEEKSKQ